MIDIHSHILPMVDDGCQSIDQALQMLDQAYRDGTDEIVLTPHLAYPYHFENPSVKIKGLFSDFQRIVKDAGIPVKLYPGCEFLFDSVESFYEHLDEITTCNDTRYLLMEFFFDADGKKMIEAVRCAVENDLIPVIAHPERYESIQVSDHLAKDLVSSGALLQMNKGSVFGKYGTMARDTVMDLLEAHLISFAGSDGHHPVHRSARMYRDYQFVKELYGRDYSEAIFNDNAAKMLRNVDIRGTKE